MPPLNHFATFCVKNVMGKAHIQRKVTALPEHLPPFTLILLQNCAALIVFPLNLMWHLKDYGIFRKLQGSDFSGYLTGSDAVIERKCCLQEVVRASYGAILQHQPNCALCVLLIKHLVTQENEDKIQENSFHKGACWIYIHL